MKIPTTQELQETFLTIMEERIGQTSPFAEKAFLRVVSASMANMGSQLLKIIAWKARQSFAMTAEGENLDSIGREYGEFRKPAQESEFLLVVEANAGVRIPFGLWFVAANRYRWQSSEVAIADDFGEARVRVIAEIAGSEAMLKINDTLTMQTQVGGAKSTGRVIDIIKYGLDRESDDVYRRRVLTAVRQIGGGGNASDYRRWAEEVPGVKRAYPYSGAPFGQVSYPGQRTVYVEAERSIATDGIPLNSLLEDVRQSVNFDKDGKGRPPLGLTDDTLFVEPISRVNISVEIRGLKLPETVNEGEIKRAITDEFGQYISGVCPYVQSVDWELDRNDTISNIKLSEILYGIIGPIGGTVNGLGFYKHNKVYLPNYIVSGGTLARLEMVEYVS